jgi:acylphosphatase
LQQQESDCVAEPVRQKVIYRGRVQGVGFRATARSIASRFEVAGYVRNCSDGSVELVAEGSAAEVQSFLDALALQMASYIDTSEAGRLEGGEPFQGFRIR